MQAHLIMATSNPLKSGSDKTAIEKLQTQLFVTEFSAIDERINTCSYWIDFACFGGDDDAVFRKLKNLLQALRDHRDRCRQILVSFTSSP